MSLHNVDQESVHGSAQATKNPEVQNTCDLRGKDGVEAQYVNNVSYHVPG